MSEDTQLPVTVPVTTPLPADFDTAAIAKLARDVAIGMESLPTILTRHKITEAQYASLQQNPYFCNTVEVIAQEWHKPSSTLERLALQAAMALELGAPKLAARMTNDKEPLSSVGQIAQMFMELSGAKNKNAAPVISEKFTINIDLGGDVRMHFGSREGAEKAREVREVTEGPSNARPVQFLAKEARIITDLLPDAKEAS